MYFIHNTSLLKSDVRALYLRGDPYESSDAVFGVKESLLIDMHPASESIAKEYNIKHGAPVLSYDFVLASEKEASDLRDERSRKAMAGLGRRTKLIDGLPVPDVD